MTVESYTGREIRPNQVAPQTTTKSVTDKTKEDKSKLSQKVIDFFFENIVEGIYQPGQKISPKEIAGRLQISGSPVRDALERLERDGWIERFPQSGTYIKQISLRDIEEVYELRSMLEAGAVELAIARMTPQQLEDLKETVDILNRAAKSNFVEEYEKADTNFHHKLVAATANESVINAFNSVLRKTRCYFIALKATKHDLRTIAEIEHTSISHTHIVQAIIDKNTKLAKKLIKDHIEISCEWNKAMAKIHWLYIKQFQTS